MLKKIIFIAAMLVLGIFLFQWGAQKLLEAFSLRAFEFLERDSDELELLVSGAQYENVKLRLPDSVLWSGVSMEMSLPASEMLGRSREFSLSIDELQLRMENPFSRAFSLSGKRLGVVLFPEWGGETSSLRESVDRIEGDFFYRFRFDFLKPGQAALQELKAQLQELAALLRDGRTAAKIEFSGKSHFLLEGKPVAVRISIVKEKGISMLRMNPQDISSLSKFVVGEELTETELQLLSRYPVRAPKLVEIQNFSVRESRRLDKEQEDFPQDAYKHVLWSYLLTRQYGPEFSQWITDAHEVGDPDTTPEDSAMDYHNNSIGRGYALKGYSQDSILERFLKDPSVIRKKADAAAAASV